MKKTTVTRTSLPPFEEFCAQIRPLWDSRILTNMGTLHQKLEAELKKGRIEKLIPLSSICSFELIGEEE